MGKNQLIHSNELHLIEKAEIHNAAKKMVESLNLDIYKVVEVYFTDLEKRHQMNQLLGIQEDCAYYGAKEQEAECAKAEAANE